MERFNMIYSEKNIPIPSKEDYKIQLISKTEKFIKRMRWKALEFLGNLHSSDKITFGSKSRNCPPIVEELENFENELMFMIKKIQFRKVNNSFQRQLNEDITQIKRDSKIFGSADKSPNIYKMDRETYEKLLHENITKTYKKTDKKKVRAINIDAKKIAKDLELEDRIEKMQKSECYITVKTNPPIFIKWTGETYEKLLHENITKIFGSANIRNKNNASFIVFDIERFYPPISLELFHEAINFVKTICDIPEKDISIIMQSR